MQLFNRSPRAARVAIAAASIVALAVASGAGYKFG